MMFPSEVQNDNKVLLVDSIPVGCESVLTESALRFVGWLHDKHNDARLELLRKREVRNAAYAAGVKPDFKPETAKIRNGEWRVATIPEEIQDRRVEITGPTDAKMMINALNSGAKVFMADLEDSTAPSWENAVSGQLNLYHAVRRTLTFEKADGKRYEIGDNPAVLMVRPRGLHLEEAHAKVGGKPISGSLFDFGMFFFHNAAALWEKGSAPYFYLPKLEDAEEAAWWNAVFVDAQRAIGIPRGTIKATVLVETLPIVFQMHEVLHALREHSAGLNCGRWDYLFSMIKVLGQDAQHIFPDRSQMTMTVECMRAYSRNLIRTCHTRGAHAMGGMAAQIPIKNDSQANDRAMERVKNDKLREVQDGHDGTWVAHPGLVPLAMEVFNEYMPEPNQIGNIPDWNYTAEQLNAIPEGTITEEGIRTNISVGVNYVAAWLSGNGAAAINHLMEDAATAEISRVQLWQWLKYKVTYEGGKVLDDSQFELLFFEEMVKLERSINPAWKSQLATAKRVFHQLVKRYELAPFTTTEAYAYLA